MKNLLFSLSADGQTDSLKNALQKNDNEVNQKGDLDYSPLAMAVARGHLDAARLLLEHGADVNTQDYKGNTPLHYVAEYNYTAAAKMLLEYGADLSIKNNAGNQPLWVAVFSAADGDQAKVPLVDLFVKSGADPYHENNVGKTPIDIAKKIDLPYLVDLLAGNQ